MRGKWVWARWAILVSGLSVGCQVMGPPPLKPPLHEEYTLPPANDPRFNNPPTYPKETMDSEQFKKEQSKPPQQFNGPQGGFGPGPRGGMGGF